MVPLSDRAVAVIAATEGHLGARSFVFINAATGDRYSPIVAGHGRPPDDLATAASIEFGLPIFPRRVASDL